MASFENKWLKKRFIDKGPKELTEIAARQDPWVAMARKEQMGGTSIAEPVKLSGPKGWSSSLAGAQLTSAQVNNGASDDDEFNSTFGQYFGSATFSARAVEGGKSNLDSYARVIENEVTSAVARFGEVLGRALAGPIGNSIGKVSSGSGTGLLVLTLRGDTYNFVPGMVVDAASADGSNGTITVRAGHGFVIATDPDGSANVQVSTTEGGAAGQPSGWTDGDFLFRAGDMVSSIDNSAKGIRSLQAWIRLTNPSAATTFNGVTIGKDTRLSGIKVSAADANSLSILDRVQLICTEMASASGASPDYVSMAPRTYAQAMAEAQTYGRFQLGEDPKLGIKKDFFSIFTAAGMVKVICNPHQLEADIWVLTSDHICIYNYSGLPHLRDEDGVMFLRSGEGYEVQFTAFTNVTVDGRPDKFGRIASGN